MAKIEVQIIKQQATTVSTTMTFNNTPIAVIITDYDEVSTLDQMNIVLASGVLDFWKDKAENIYK